MNTTKLAKFGQAVLEILERDKDWSADTTGVIAQEAFDNDLADTETPEGFFRIKK